MFVELLMKKNGKIIFALFLILVVAATIFGGVLVYDAMNTDIYKFTKDGYALSFSTKNNTKAVAYSFKNGAEYQYKRNSNTINFQFEEEKVRLDENAIMHYSDGSLGVLKKVVGLDVSTIDRPIIFYYNIYKDTKITATPEGYNIKLFNDTDVVFKNLLIRVSDTKFMLTGKNVKLILNQQNIIDFGDYVEFEYVDGNIVKVYNQDKFYQTISNEAYLSVDDITINLSEAVVSKANKEYISLTNLVVDSDGNIDTLEEEIEKKEVYLENGEIEVPTITPPDTSIVSGNKGEGNGNENNASNDEDDKGDKGETVDKNKIDNTPSYKISNLSVTTRSVEAEIHIEDKDYVITSDTDIYIVENKSGKEIESCQESGTMGDEVITYSCMTDMKPDTEYTLYAKATYKVDNTEIERVFLSKIFRTQALGVSFEPKFITNKELEIEIEKEKYSKVRSVSIILKKDEEIVNQQKNILLDYDIVSVPFSGLTSNTEYTIEMTDIICDDVLDTEYNELKNVKTLKEKPDLNKIALTYQIDKKNNAFNLIASGINDLDYGVKNYRYEVYRADSGFENQEPVAIINKSDLAPAVVKIDNIDNYSKNFNYTYVLVIEFFDNEKIVEYTKKLDSTMSMGSNRYPTIIQPKQSKVTWEQFTTSFEIEDPENTIINDDFVIVYKNSIDVENTISKIDQGSEVVNYKVSKDPYGTYTIDISVNYLRKNETYTFEIYGNINLGDGNGDVHSYLGNIYVQTTEPDPAKVKYTLDETSHDKQFNVNVTLESTMIDGKEPWISKDFTYEAGTLSKVIFELRSGVVDPKEFNDATNPKIGSDYIIYDDDYDIEEKKLYESTIGKKIYKAPDSANPEGVNLIPELFGVNSLPKGNYTIVVKKAYDYTKTINEIPIIEQFIPVTVNAEMPPLPDDINDAVDVVEITNLNVSDYGEVLESRKDLDLGTVFGYAVVPKVNNDQSIAEKINWKVKECKPLTNSNNETNTNEEEKYDCRYLEEPEYTEITLSNDYNLPTAIFRVESGDEYIENEMNSTGNTTSKLKRGYIYFFEYTIDMDLNQDDVISENEVYPSKDKNGKEVILISKELTPLKQAARIEMYPYKSYVENTNNENLTNKENYAYEWKYKIYDIDQSLTKEMLTVGDDGVKKTYLDVCNQSDNTNNPTEIIEINDDNNYCSKGEVEIFTDYNKYKNESYKTVVFKNLSEGKIQIFKKEKIHLAAEKRKETILSQYFSSIKKSSDISIDYTAEVNLDRNELFIKIADDNVDMLKSIALINVIVKDVNGEVSPKIFENQEFDNSGTAKISLLELKEFFDKNISVELELFYDTGHMGFCPAEEGIGCDGSEQYNNNEFYVALQNNATTKDEIGYYEFNKDDKLSSVPNANLRNGMFKVEMKDDEQAGKILKIKKYDGKEYLIPYKPTQRGIEVEFDRDTHAIVILKLIKSKMTEPVIAENKISRIIPGIDVKYITGLLKQVKIKAQVDQPDGPDDQKWYGFLQNIDNNNDIVIKIYETSSKDLCENSDYAPSETDVKGLLCYKAGYDLSSFNNDILIAGLQLDKEYNVGFYVYYEEDGEMKSTLMYDVVLKQKKIYKVKTKEGVTFTDFEWDFEEHSYSHKDLNIRVVTDPIDGYTGIRACLFTPDVLDSYIEGSENVDVCHEDNRIDYKEITNIKDGKTIVFSVAPPNGHILYGSRYKVRLIPYLEENGEVINFDYEDFEINMPKAKPAVGSVIASKSGNDAIFKVSFKDPEFVIINGEFDYMLIDESGAIVLQKDENGNVIYKIDNQGNKIQPVEGEDYFYKASINTINQHFEYKNLPEGEYTFIVKTNLDMSNNQKNKKTQKIEKKIVIGDFISVGEVKARQGNNESQILLEFYDYYRLTDIKTISYYIFEKNQSTGTGQYSYYKEIKSNEIVWSSYGNNAMSIEIFAQNETTNPDTSKKMLSGHVYVIELNFYDEDANLVDQSTVYYTYNPENTLST